MAYRKISVPILEKPGAASFEAAVSPRPTMASAASYMHDIPFPDQEYMLPAPAPTQEKKFHIHRRPLGAKRGRRRWTSTLWFALSLILGFVWVVPILFLLVVNIQGRIIGAAAWCPGGNCQVLNYVNASGPSATAALSAGYDLDNHNLMGALQFVAKALEGWFVFVATSLMWQLTLLLAQRPEGIPIGYLLTHREFADLLLLLDPIFYTTARTGKAGSAPRKRRTAHVRLFLAAAIFMCILANLIGPSIAVLLIPTLGWQDGAIVPTGQFQQLNAGSAPAGNNAILGCNATQLEAGQWGCAGVSYGDVLDSLSTTIRNEFAQIDNIPSGPAVAITQNTAVTLEEAIPFSFNLTTPNKGATGLGTMWTPLRQAVRGLSEDFENLYAVMTDATQNQTTIDQFSDSLSSLQLVLQRYGPMIGLVSFASTGNLTVTEVAPDKLIRCYQNYDPFVGVTKCMRTGIGWNSTTAWQNFTVDAQRETGSTVAATVYWADQALWLNDTSDPCFVNGTVDEGTNCDYDALFAAGATANATANGDRTADMLVAEWRLVNGPSPDFAFLVEFFPGFGFATYSIDVTQILPSLTPMEVRSPPEQSELVPIVLHPAWFLAAWNTDDGGDVSSTSSASAVLLQANLIGYYNEVVAGTTSTGLDGSLIGGISLYAAAHAASLVNYNTSGVPPSDAQANLPANQPLLWSNVYHKVWGWGIGSRTSKVGVLVCILGVLAVLVRTGLLLWTRAKTRSTLDLLSTAMRHEHAGELQGAERESDAARLHYQLVEDKTVREPSLRLRHVAAGEMVHG